MSKKCCCGSGGNVYTLEKTYVNCCVAIAGATVNQAGEIVSRCGDTNFNIVRAATGNYIITPPPGAIFAHIEAIEGPATADSIEAHMGTSFTGGTAWIGEGDNGTAANVFRDRPFSIVWFGEKEFLDDVTLVAETGDGATTREVDVSNLFHASVDPQDIHDAAATLAITQTRADAGWTAAADGADYAGTPDSVEVNVNVQVDENATSNYWALPEIIVERNGTRIGSASAVLMQNIGTYSNQTTLAGVIVDPNPGTNPSYRFTLEDDDNRTNEAIPQDHAHVSLRAYEKIQVYVPAI